VFLLLQCNTSPSKNYVAHSITVLTVVCAIGWIWEKNRFVCALLLSVHVKSIAERGLAVSSNFKYKAKVRKLVQGNEQIAVYRLADRCLSRVRWRRCRRLCSCATRWTSSAWFRWEREVSSTGEHPTAAGLCRLQSRDCCCNACGVQWTDWLNLGVLPEQLNWLRLTPLWSKLPDKSTSKTMSWFAHGVHGADFAWVPLGVTLILAMTQKQQTNPHITQSRKKWYQHQFQCSSITHRY